MPEAIGWQIQTKLNFNIKERILKSYTSKYYVAAVP